MRIILALALLLPQLLPPAAAQTKKAVALDLPISHVLTVNGPLQGTTSATGIHEFRGVPFAAPPVGELRWRAPQPVKNWKTVRMAKAFGPRAMQLPLFDDMNFRSAGVSEDCLYLNVWTPAKTGREKLPVLVYFYGGGFVAGDGSEPRYDGESMARRGLVAVTVNYRLGVFGFLAHPELTKESAHHAAGNYGLLDQSAALRWVQQNITAFGGDPTKVTIAGESAGSMSVSAQMASPLSKALFARAIGESGSFLNTSYGPVPLAEAERTGTAFADSLGATSLAALRALPAQQLLAATGRPGAPRFPPTIDGYFFTQAPTATFAAGQQAHVPLLVGWNSQESGPGGVVGGAPATAENFRQAVQTLYGPRATDVLSAYPASSDAEAEQAATDLASDRFIAYSTWKWADMQQQTGGQPVYRYLYARPRPAPKPASNNPSAPPRGAVHSAEIEYALGNLGTNKVFAWAPGDFKTSETMQSYFANFAKTGNPNGPGLPTWPQASTGQLLRLDVNTQAVPDNTRPRYLLLDELMTK